MPSPSSSLGGNTPVAYYNEIDPKAAAWLRVLIAEGHIAPGEVDERSITEVTAGDVAGFTQCHFFAGIGVWSYALRRAGWPDTRPVWTGSCPCQPFSSSGKKQGFADERHLWPDFFRLIRERRPGVCFGEQVASKDGLVWLDALYADLEGAGYAVGAVDTCAAGVGAPHIRQRLYWVADANGARFVEHTERDGGSIARRETVPCGNDTGRCDELRRMANADSAGRRGRRASEARNESRSIERSAGFREAGGLAYARCDGAREYARELPGDEGQHAERSANGDHAPLVERAVSELEFNHADGASKPTRSVGGQAGPTNGLWRAADWLYCTDGKWRPVESSPQPLADGFAESLGRVRPDAVEEITKEVSDACAMEGQGDSRAALRDLCGALAAETSREWASRRVPRLHAAPFLLAFLRQLKEQGWALAEGCPLSREEVARGELRVLWSNAAASSASRERGLVGQLAGERPDTLHFLSPLLARHAQAAWGDAYATYAEIGFPLAHGARSRVTRLRGYGNAINAEVAAAFIEAYLGVA